MSIRKPTHIHEPGKGIDEGSMYNDPNPGVGEMPVSDTTDRFFENLHNDVEPFNAASKRVPSHLAFNEVGTSPRRRA